MRPSTAMYFSCRDRKILATSLLVDPISLAVLVKFTIAKYEQTKLIDLNL